MSIVDKGRKNSHFPMARFLSGPVTGLGLFEGRIYIASGETVKVLDQVSKSIIKEVILPGGLIRRITKEFIIAGNHIYNFDLIKLYSLDCNILPREHILDALKVFDKMFILTVHGYVVILGDNYKRIALIESPESGVLYSGLIIHFESELLFAYGTIFSGIQVYKLISDKPNGYSLEKSFSLSGHKGSIFALEFRSPHYLASASDDRSVCAWDISVGKRIFCGYGHRARIWSIAFSQYKNYIVSASEDGDLRLWDFITGECLSTFEGHMGRHVWSVAFESDSIISGGNDGSVRKWSIAPNKSREFFWGPEGKRTVRSFFVNSCESVMLTLDNGEILDSDSENGQILRRLSPPLPYLANYSTTNGQFVGGLTGTIYDNQNKVCYQLDEDKVVQIFDSKGHVLINYASGKIFMDKIPIPLLGIVTSFLSSSNHFYIGFRNGNIAILERNTKANTVVASILLRPDAITGIIEFNNQITICDRSGHLMILENFDIFSDIKIHQGFLEKLLILNGNLLAAGFYQKNFFIYDIKRCLTLFKIPCGGGHRQWQLYHKSEVSDEMVFAYLRKKNMHVIKFVIEGNNSHECLIPAFHGREIRGLLVLGGYVLTGDEEGTIILSEYVNSSLIPISYIKNAHNNGIKSLKKFRDNLVISVGSGEELKIWKLSDRNLYLIKSYTSLTDDVRFMAVDVDDNLIYVAGSDGKVRIFDEHLKLIKSIHVGCCVIKIGFTGENLYAADSRGNLNLVENHELRATKNIHRNAILSLMATFTDTHLTITGGDDGEISINQNLLKPKMHFSSITALCELDSEHFISIGLDRRIVLWSYSKRSPVELFYTRLDDVSNCHMLDLQNHLLVVGNGIEILKVNWRSG